MVQGRQLKRSCEVAQVVLNGDSGYWIALEGEKDWVL